MIDATYSSRWEIRGLGTYLEAELRRELTFPNPLYVQLGKLGKFRRHVAPVVCYVEDVRGVLVVPRGFDLPAFAKAHEENLSVRGATTTAIDPIGYACNFVPREYQYRCVDACEHSHQGYIVAPTGSGKTIIALGVIAQKKQRTLVLVHTKGLLTQWVAAIDEFLGVSAGVIGGGKNKPGKEITVAMIQTLGHKRRRRDIIDDYGLVLLDECHHAPAKTYTSVLDRCTALYRYGLSATPERRDGQHYLIGTYFGEKLEEVTRKEVEKVGAVVPAEVHVVRTKSWPEAEEWGDMITGLVDDDERTELIAGRIKMEMLLGPVLVLTDRVEQAEKLHELCSDRGSVLLHGGLRASELAIAMEAAKAGPPITVATTGIMGEGIDASAWCTLVLALPVSGKGSRLTQAIGRIVRPGEGKTMARVIDIVDEHPMCLGCFRGRKRRYKELGIEVVS